MSDVGMKRSGNEDSFYCSADEGIAIVADGMGGHASGEVASALAVRIIRDVVLQRLADTGFSDGASAKDSEWMCGVLSDAIIKANAAICGKSSNSASNISRMGTTITVFLLSGDASAIAHVGDSRIYLLRGNNLFPLTRDHSLVNEQLRANLITPEEARTSIYRHIVTRALGMKELVEPETNALVILPRDLLLLCSDGLFDLVDDDTIREVLLDGREELQVAVHRLIDLANSKGGDDNITVVLAKVKSDHSEASADVDNDDDMTTILPIG